MIITNFKNLARNSLRKKALLIAEAGYQAIEIEKVVSRKIKFQNGKLFIKSVMTRHSAEACSKFDLSVYKRVSLIGIGKGSALASANLAKILGDKLTGGIALDVIKYQEVRPPRGSTSQILSQIREEVEPRKISEKLEFLTGTHPWPSKQNIKATQKIIKLLKNLKKNDLLIAFICGGGSALLCGSEKELKNSILATKLLTQAGANILELNTVRKHLSLVKAGGLAKLAYPANIISLIVSDVLGNNLSMVASGPTVFDKTTKKDAEKILDKYLRKSASKSALIRDLKETPKNKKCFKKVKNILFLSNSEPILAMAEKAKELGFKPKIYSYSLRGEAKNALLSLFKTLPYREAPKAILAVGETTVILNPKFEIRNSKQIQNSKFKIQKIGKGGRNMEAVLAALTRINADYYVDKRGYNQRKSAYRSAQICVLSVASDGRDNTKAAGAIADFSTIQKAKKLRLNPQDFLNRHDSFNFFKKTGDLIFTKKKTFNVADLMIILKSTSNE